MSVRAYAYGAVQTAFLFGQYFCYSDGKESSQKLFKAGIEAILEILARVAENPDLDPKERRQLREYHLRMSLLLLCDIEISLTVEFRKVGLCTEGAVDLFARRTGADCSDGGV